MSSPKDDDQEVNDLSEIYSTLRQDAKTIVGDLKGGIVMWREAAAGAATSVGFILIILLTFFHYTPPGTSIEGWAIVSLDLATAAIMSVISAKGFLKYNRLRKKYEPLFERAEKLK